MNKFFAIYIMSIFFISCQLAQKQPTPFREVSSLQSPIHHLAELFIKELAKKTKIPSDEIEKALINHLLRENNYKLAGLTKKEALALKNYSHDLPFTAKAINWSIHNIHIVLPKIDKSILANVYRDTYQKVHGGKNIFSDKLLIIRNKSIFDKLNFKRKLQRLNEKIQSYNSPKTFHPLEQSITHIEKRAIADDSIIANANLIVESAYSISSKTGLSSMGKGCSQFLANAPAQVYAMKANIDQFRAKYIETLAHKKNNYQNVTNFTKIPEHLRVNQNEIDQATILAFQKILGHSKEEAKKTLNLLKREPCQLY